MKLYICYGTFLRAPRPGGHPCGNANAALEKAGYHPELVKSYGLGVLPDALANWTPARREVKRLTGNSMVPVLQTDEGEVIEGSHAIKAWAEAHPAT